jgi:hypothetical protein
MTTLLGASIPKRTLSLPSRTTVRTIESPSFTLWLSLRESTSIRHLRVAGDICGYELLFRGRGSGGQYSSPLLRRAKGVSVDSRGRSANVWVSVDARRFGQFCLLKALATRTVKKDLVAIGFPNRGKPGQPWTVQAEENATGFSTP